MKGMCRRDFLTKIGALALFGGLFSGFRARAAISRLDPTTVLDNAFDWLSGQVSGNMIGGPITTDWSAQGLVATLSQLGRLPPDLEVCNDPGCLVPSTPMHRRLRSAERAVLSRLAFNQPTSQTLVDLIVSELTAEIDPGHERYPFVPTKTCGVLTLDALSRDLGIHNPDLRADLISVLGTLQNLDGGWPLAYDGQSSSISDLTAEAVLCGLPDNGWLSDHQNPDGGIAYGGPLTFSNCDSTCWLLLAQPGNQPARDWLTACQHPLGYFMMDPGTDWPNDEQRYLATANGLLALSSTGFPVPQLPDPASLEDELLVKNFRLSCSPTPFRDHLEIILSGPDSGNSSLSIYDLKGCLVWQCVLNGDCRQKLQWDGTDNHGARVPAGIYLVRITTPDGFIAKKVTRLH